MKKLFLNAAAILAALGLNSMVSTSYAAPTDQKIGTIDLQRVFKEYYKTDRSTQALKQEAAELQKERKEMVDSAKKKQEDWQKLIDKSEDQAVSAEERAKSQKAARDKLADLKDADQTIQAYDRQSSAKLQEKERQRRDDIVREIRGVLNAEAKTAGYTLVLDVSGESANMAPVVLYTAGVNDMTDGLIKELNAGAPVSLPDAKPGK